MHSPPPPAVEEADVAAVAAALPADGAVLIDVRERWEWQAGHARGARHIPLAELPASLDSLPRSAPIYLICATGRRSHNAAAYLRQAGFARPINVRGGTEAWRRAGLPTDR
jgi:rhodanese-related sulfurtransferase